MSGITYCCPLKKAKIFIFHLTKKKKKKSNFHIAPEVSFKVPSKVPIWHFEQLCRPEKSLPKR